MSDKPVLAKPLKLRANNTSGYHGVTRMRDRWQAFIVLNRKKRHIGIFKDKREAAEAYDKAAAEHFGEKATFNFPGVG